MIKKLLVLALSMIMLTNLAACGDDNGDVNVSKEETDASSETEYIYVHTNFNWGIENQDNVYVNTYGVTNDCLIGIKSEINMESGEQTQAILKYNIVNGTLESVPYVSESPSEFIKFVSMKPDGALVACAEDYQPNEETGEVELQYRVLFIDAAGQISDIIDLSEICAEIEGKYDSTDIRSFAVDSDQTIYLTFEKEIVALKSNGKKLFSIESDNMFQSVGNTSNGDVYAVYFGQSGIEISMIDRKAEDFGAKYELSNYDISGSFELAEDGILYFNDGNAIYKADLKTGDSEEILQWLDEGIDSQLVMNVEYIDENTFFVHNYNPTTNEEGYVKLVKTDKELLKDKSGQGIIY